MSFPKRLVKSIFFSTPLYRYFLPVMKFDMTMTQLSLIISELSQISAAGAVLEVGVGGGATSVLINQALRGIDTAREFVAVDTFNGFTQEDVMHEKSNRGKSSDYSFYRSNSADWYRKTLRAYGFSAPKIYSADCKMFDFSIVQPIAFCLFDVDLYLPTITALPRIYENLAPGGIIIVDDCDMTHELYDGAGQAYLEFCLRMGITPDIRLEKLGIIRKCTS